MGAVSIVEDMVKRWDEIPSRAFFIGPAGPSKGDLPPELKIAFLGLCGQVEVARQIVQRLELNESFEAIARRIDTLHEQVERFGHSLLFETRLRKIHSHANALRVHFRDAETLWSQLIDRLRPFIDEIGRLDLAVQKLNPELHDRYLTAGHREARQRAQMLLGGLRWLTKLRDQRLDHLREQLLDQEARRAMDHGGLPPVDKDAEQDDEPTVRASGGTRLGFAHS